MEETIENSLMLKKKKKVKIIIKWRYCTWVFFRR